MTTPSERSAEASPRVPQATFRIVHGPSLEGLETVAVVTVGSGAATDHAPVGVTTASVVRSVLDAAGLTAREPWGPETPTSRAIVLFVHAFALSVQDGEGHGIRASRVQGPEAFVMDAFPGRVLRRALRLAGEVLTLAQSGDVAAATMAHQVDRIRKAQRESAAAPAWQDSLSDRIGEQAIALGIPGRWSAYLPQTYILGEGRRQVRMHGSYPLTTPTIARHLTVDKTWLPALLQPLGLPVPVHRVVENAAAAVAAAERIGFPVVLKPIDSSMSTGVTVNVRTPAEVREAFAVASAHGKTVMVQPFLDTDDFRAYVLGGRLRFVYRRNAPYVVGDGRSTVQALIDAHNIDVEAGRPRFPARMPTVVDDHLRETIAKAGYALDSVLARDEKLILRAIAPRVKGGYMVDVTKAVHPENVRLFERALALSGLLLTGLDFRAEAVERPWYDQRFAILELNLRPGIMDDETGSIADALVRCLFPTTESAKLPTVLAIDERDRPTVGIDEAMRATGLTIGVSGPDGQRIDGILARREATAIGAAHALLIEDPTADAAIYVARSRDIASGGLGLAQVDVALLPAQPRDALAAAVDQLVRRHARTVLPLPEGLADRDSAIARAAAAAVAGRPLPPHCR